MNRSLSSLFVNSFDESASHSPVEGNPKSKSFVEFLEEKLAGDGKLAEQYIVPPFSILDAGQPRWEHKQLKWLTVFDPLLCEIVYDWFLPKKKGHILDPFGTDPTRGMVAGYLGCSYTGFTTKKQAEINHRQALVLQARQPSMVLPKWIGGRPDQMDKALPDGETYDLVFSGLPVELSNWEKEIVFRVQAIFKQAISRLKDNRFIFVLSHTVHGDDGFIKFSPEFMTKILKSCDGVHYYNRMEIVMSGVSHGGLKGFFKGDIKGSNKNILREFGDLLKVNDTD